MSQNTENREHPSPRITLGDLGLLKNHLNRCAPEKQDKLLLDILKQIFGQNSKDLTLKLAEEIVEHVRGLRRNDLAFLNYEYLAEFMDKAIEDDNVPLMEYLLSLSRRLEKGQMPSYGWSDQRYHKDIKQVGPRSARMMRVLVQNGFNINQRAHGHTTLHFALASPYTDDESVQLIKYLASKIQDINQTDEHGYTALHAWLHETQEDRWRGKKDVVREITTHLLDNHASLAATAKEENGDTPLHFVAQSASLSLVELFLSRGADKDARNKDGKTPHDYAQRFKDSADDDEKKVYTLMMK
ncbi:unnamed protein product [Clonostachys rhizophaga]|uniref:Ankyrin repeat protein n=1 Tax=Clonostachys rhizophaga TaxID=160324 RepID=A0A9N9YR77_9HYPO|nr:unnamed protein product [Clonostachys rhizophaga]